MALLLLADESETQVRSYIQLGDLYVFSTGERPDETAGIVLTTPQQPGVVELKAVAVEPRFQRQGIGLHMISGVRQNLQGMKVQKEEKYFILGNIAAASGLLSMWESSNVFFGRRVESDTFEAMALPHLNDLYRTAVHFVRDRTEAHDLVQEAYLQAWKAFHRFEPGTNCRAWLFKILINEIRHYRRRWFNTETVSEAEQSFEETLAFEPPVAEDIQDEDVLAALDEIPREFREVVLLSDVQEFSYKEIAEMLGIPVGTVMSRLSRGRKQLRMKLANYVCSTGLGRKLIEGAYERG